MLQTLKEYNQIQRGLSYWKVKLTDGSTRSEMDVDWTVMVERGETARITEVVLCTPKGEAHLTIGQPYSAIQCKRGSQALFTGEHLVLAQIVGRIEDSSGRCLCVIWDVIEQKLYTDVLADATDFAAWRPGVPPIGALNLAGMGARL